MRDIRIVFLFLFFVGVISFVRVADAKSQLYEDCAVHWVELVEATKTQPYQKAYLLEKLISTDPVMINDQVCPRLLPNHQEILEKALKPSEP